MTDRSRENPVQQAILAYLGSQRWCRLFRNNTGVFRTMDGERIVRVGLCTGSADLVGLLAPDGRFLAIEAKRPGARPSETQGAFLRMIRELGGIGISACSLEDAKRQLAELGYPR